MYVPAGGNLQAALSQAQAGDTITLQAGAVFQGNFTLPQNAGNTYITIQSSNVSSLPGVGHRVSKANRPNMAVMQAINGWAVFTARQGNNHIRFIGIEFATTPGMYTVGDLIQFGAANETSYAQLPYDLVIDRCYLHGDPSQGSKRGVAMNSGYAAVENSYFDNFFSTYQDTQAIAGWNGPGPYRITNNYLEAGTETVAFGGAVPSIYGNIPSDIMISHNDFFKPQSWNPFSSSYAGVPVTVKNHLELKFGNNVTIDANTFTNNWAGPAPTGPQRGFALVFTVRTEVNQVPWATINNIIVTNNHFINSAAGINITGHDDNPQGSGSQNGMLIQNNQWDQIGGNGGDGRLFQILNGARNIYIDSNTANQQGFIAVFDVGTSYRINLTNNVFNRGGGGIAGNGTAEGNSTLAAYDQGGAVSGNVFYGSNPGSYPVANTFTGDINAFTQGTPASLGKGSNMSGFVGVPTAYVEIRNRVTNKCAQLSGTGVGASLQEWDCNGSAAQHWLIMPNWSVGGYVFVNQANDLVLQAQNDSLANGTWLIAAPYSYRPSSTWLMGDAGGGYVTFSPSNAPGSKLDLSNWGDPTNGTTIFSWASNGAPNQNWYAVTVN